MRFWFLAKTYATLVVVSLCGALALPATATLAQTETEPESEAALPAQPEPEAQAETEPAEDSPLRTYTEAEPPATGENLYIYVGETGSEPVLRIEAKSIDVETDLDVSLPQPGAIFPKAVPYIWANFKKELYQKRGLAIGLSYQNIYQYASKTLTGNNHAAAGWFLAQAKWEMYQRGKDFQGSFIAALDWRHTYGNAAQPGLWLFETGSLWATDAGYFAWDPYFTVFFLEQWFKKERFVVRLGQLTANSVFNWFRFDDGRTQFSNSQLSFPVATVPLGPPAFGLNFKIWPKKDSELYIVGTITDINGPAPPLGIYDWSGIFQTGEVLAGLELGYFWRRTENDFDHAHIDFWYATKASRKTFLSDDGWGFRVVGDKQINDWVVFGIYSFNTAQGGGFGLTNSAHAVDVGFGYLNPIHINGDFAFDFSWARPLDKPDPFRGVISDRDQFSFETYWRFLIIPDLWLSPGFQFIIHPSFAPQTNVIAIPEIRFRVAL